MTDRPTPFANLCLVCEEGLDFELTLPIVVRPERDTAGRMRYDDARDAVVAIEIFNKKGDKIVQVRNETGESIDQLALRAVKVLEEKGFIK